MDGALVDCLQRDGVGRTALEARRGGWPEERRVLGDAGDRSWMGIGTVGR
jgi:hypothetical protein